MQRPGHASRQLQGLDRENIRDGVPILLGWGAVVGNTLRCVDGVDVAGNQLRGRTGSDSKVVRRLQVHPQLGSRPKVARQPETGVGGQAPALVDDVTDARDRDTQLSRKTIDTETQGRHEILLQDLARVDRRQNFLCLRHD